MQDTACYREAIRLGYFLNVSRQTDSPQSRALRRTCPVAGVWLVPRVEAHIQRGENLCTKFAQNPARYFVCTVFAQASGLHRICTEISA